jgi:hypothetical protein
MGGNISLATSNEYSLNGEKLKVTLIGGEAALKRTVKDGSVVRVEMKCSILEYGNEAKGVPLKTMLQYLQKYFNSKMFVSDLNNDIILYYPL